MMDSSFSDIPPADPTVSTDDAEDSRETNLVDDTKDTLHQARYYANRCGDLATRFKQTNLPNDFIEATRMAQESLEIVVSASPESPRDGTRVLIGRGFEWSPNLGILMDAAKTLPTASLSESETECLVSLFSVISLRLELRFGQTGRIEDIQDAISCLELALQIATGDSWELQKNLASLWEVRFGLTGSLNDLGSSVSKTRMALSGIPENHEDRATLLLNLGDRLERRYVVTESLDDLNEAVGTVEQARDAVLEYSKRVRIGCNLSDKLESRFAQTGNPDDLRLSFELAQNAADFASIHDPDYGWILRGLGCRLYKIFESSREIEDLDAAIIVSLDAIIATPVVHPDRPEREKEYSMRILTRFYLTEDPNDLDFMTKPSEALRLLAYDHPESARLLHLFAPLGRLHPRKDDSISLDYFLRVGNCQSNLPDVRILSLIEGFHILRLSKAWPRANSIAKQAIELLQLLDTHIHNTQDKTNPKTTFISDFIADACSVNLQHNPNPTEALELLELGYGSITALDAQESPDLIKLKAWYPEIASTFAALRKVINELSPHSHQPHIRQGFVRRRRIVTQELDDCISTIRQLPGHDRFLVGPSTSELQEYAGDSVIVIVNVTEMRSDAIVVSKSSVSAISLPELNFDTIKKWNKSEKRENILDSDCLVSLSRLCVMPVLAEIGSVDRSKELFTIHWIGIGLARDLSFEAAAKLIPE